jgi:hypothetical protein
MQVDCRPYRAKAWSPIRRTIPLLPPWAVQWLSRSQLRQDEAGLDHFAHAHIVGDEQPRLVARASRSNGRNWNGTKRILAALRE